MPHDVFVSYSSRDNATALAVVQALEANGIRCWIAPRDIKAGDVWAQAIVDAIGGARVFVLVFSSHANRSGHLVNEVDAAIRKGVTPIAFRIEEVMPEGAMEYHLRTRHWLDALSTDQGKHLNELVATVRQALNLGPAVPVPATEYGTFGPPSPAATPAAPAVAASGPKSGPRVESTDTSFHLKVPKRIGMPRKGLLALVAAGAVAAGWLSWRLIGSGDVANVKFEYQGNDGGARLTVPIETKSLQFFEGPAQSPPFNSPDRRYSKVFTAAQTRYIHTEITMRLAAPGRFVVLPIGCTVFDGGGNVTGSFTIENTIQPAATNWVNDRAWGAERPGSWKPGKYRVDCRYGEKLVARSSFQVLS